MKAYKGFSRDMTCRGFQFEEGKSYEEESAELCKSGFHACERPLDVFRYYPPADSVYHEVELDEVSAEKSNDDTKICAKKITVGAKIELAGLVHAQLNYVKRHTTSSDNAGNRGAANAGDWGAANAGYCGAANAGYWGAATSRGSSSVGKNGIAVSRGKKNIRVRGKKGALLVIVIEDETSFSIKHYKTVIVDGDVVKEDVWYKLENGELVEA